MDILEDDEDKDVLIFDTWGVRNITIKKIAWHVFEYKNYQQEPRGYRGKSKGKVYYIVN